MQHIIGVAIGAVVTYALLVLFTPSTDPNTWYLASVIVGAIVALAWPWVIGLVFVRRARSRREDEIQKEVERQMGQQGR